MLVSHELFSVTRRSTAILAVGPAGIVPADNKLTRRDARLPHRQDACATMKAENGDSFSAGRCNQLVNLKFGRRLDQRRVCVQIGDEL